MRKGELFINYLVTIGPVIFLVLLSLSTSLANSMPQTASILMIALLVIGFSLFIKAKVSIISKKRLFTFGSMNMTTINKYMYYVGYGLMLMGFFVLLGYLVAQNI